MWGHTDPIMLDHIPQDSLLEHIKRRKPFMEQMSENAMEERKQNKNHENGIL
jgi:hypothetical protein